jgi:hypothetical protein
MKYDLNVLVRGNPAADGSCSARLVQFSVYHRPWANEASVTDESGEEYSIVAGPANNCPALHQTVVALPAVPQLPSSIEGAAVNKVKNARVGERCAKDFCEDPSNCPRCMAGLLCRVDETAVFAGTKSGVCIEPNVVEPHHTPAPAKFPPGVGSYTPAPAKFPPGCMLSSKSGQRNVLTCVSGVPCPSGPWICKRTHGSVSSNFEAKQAAPVEVAVQTPRGDAAKVAENAQPKKAGTDVAGIVAGVIFGCAAVAAVAVLLFILRRPDHGDQTSLTANAAPSGESEGP